ncbi:MAG: type II toxin-antitoxin system death-on-curing family toxin [Actinobacteria bacterium]|nr:type II toxin-antitoxin system death-on-curing family toxin [Actinomycetota bacterium]
MAQRFTYLSADDLIAMHAAEVPGASLLNLDRVQAVAAAPQHTFDGEDLYPTLALKAAALAYGIAQGHCFTDGNKRTALLVLPIFVGMNGHKFLMGESDLMHVIHDVASGLMSKEELGAAIEQAIVGPPDDYC